MINHLAYIQTMSRKLFLILFAAFTIFTTTQSFAQGRSVVVRSTTLKLFDFFDLYYVAGKCQSEKSRNYYAKTAGVVDFITQNQGANIRQGDIVMSIDREIAHALLAKHNAEFKANASSYERDQKLFAKQVISEYAFEKSKSAFESSKHALADAVTKHNDMIITAPFDAYLGVIKAKIGDQIKIGDYLFSITSQAKQFVIIEIPESLHKLVTNDTEVKVTNSNGISINGKITAISNYISDHGTFSAKVIIDDSDFIDGSYVDIKLILNKHQGLALPESAVLKNEHGNFIYKITNNNIVKQQYVKLGSRTDHFVEIIANDCHVDDIIVLEGLTKVHDGVTVNASPVTHAQTGIK